MRLTLDIFPYISTCISCAVGYLYLDPAKLTLTLILDIYLYDFLDIACELFNKRLSTFAFFQLKQLFYCLKRPPLTKIHNQIDNEKNAILKLENEAVMQNERLRILRCIFSQPLVYFDLHSHQLTEVKRAFKYATTKDYILNSHWL